MNNIKNLNGVSAFYFFVIAFAYVAGALALRNGWQTDVATIGMRIMDVPLALVALLYGGSSLYLQLSEGKAENASPWGLVIFSVCIVLFSAVIFINFAFPSVI